MKINILSDIHSKCEGYRHPKIDADVLVLCGDMGENFTYDGEYKTVIRVNGNHEYYDKKESPFNNVVVVDDYVFISATLWSNFWNTTPKRLDQFKQMNRLNDFRFIKNFSFEDCKECFERDFKFIKENVKKYPNKKVIVCTHFAPSKKSVEEKYKGEGIYSYLSRYFVNDLDDFILENKNIKAWFFGHTHGSFDYKIGQCRCVENSQGYIFENEIENKSFNPKLIIKI